jgi:hypothetical protein
VDRDTSFIAMHEFIEQGTETKVVLLPPKSPNLNAYTAWWNAEVLPPPRGLI